MEDQATLGTTSLMQLPAAVQRHILLLLPPNDRALNGRLACRDMRDALSEPQHCTASLSQPLPPHAAPWAVEAGQLHVQHLAFRHKLQLLCTAAASGSEVNLEVALALLRPSIFPESLTCNKCSRKQWMPDRYSDPGVAAVSAGHPRLLGWLLHHCPALLHPGSVLSAAARHCDLEGLQMAWRVLQVKEKNANGGDSSSGSRSSSSSNSSSSDTEPALGQYVLDAAAGSFNPDAVAKMEWVLSTGICRLQTTTAAAAASSGDLGRLRWLHKRGGPFDWLPTCAFLGREDSLNDVLWSALEHADLAVLQWLVDEAGCHLPVARSDPPQRDPTWNRLLDSAVIGPDGAAKIEWLQGRGAPPQGTPSFLLHARLLNAAAAGQAETQRHLLSLVGPRRVLSPQDEGQGQAACNVPCFELLATGLGSVTTLELLHQAGFVFSGAAYGGAAMAGSPLAMVRWLACKAGVSAAERDLQSLILHWPDNTAADGRSLLEAVHLLVEKAGCEEWNITDILRNARTRGDLALVPYLLQQRPGYQPDGALLAWAVKVGCVARVEWLVGQPGLGPGPVYSMYLDAAKEGDYATLSTLRRLGVPWGIRDTLATALLYGCRVPALQWLVAQGVPVGGVGAVQDALHEMVKRGLLSGEEAEGLLGYARGAPVDSSRGCVTG